MLVSKISGKQLYNSMSLAHLSAEEVNGQPGITNFSVLGKPGC